MVSMSVEREQAKRLWWQGSLREMLLSVLVVAFSLGWFVDRNRLKLDIQRSQDALQSMAKENVLLELKLKRVFGDEWDQ